MGCLTLFRPVILTTPNFTSASFPSVSPNSQNPCYRITTRFSNLGIRIQDHNRPSCCNQEDSSSMENEHETPQDAILKVISEISKVEGRMGRTTTMILGGTATNDSTYDALSLTKMRSSVEPSVSFIPFHTHGFEAEGLSGCDLSIFEIELNIYPAARGFTAIGSGGDDFVQSMVVAVESVVQHPIPQGKVKQKLSSGGKYVSVNIGPVQIVSSKQVQAVYYAMRRDDRMRYFL